MSKEIDKKAVGQRIKRIRLEMGYTQGEFIRAVTGTYRTPSQVTNWERGKNLPNPMHLSEIAFQGQMSVDQLLRGKHCEWEELYNSADDVVEEYTGCKVDTQPSINILEFYNFKHCPYCGKELFIRKAHYPKYYTVEMTIEGEWHCIEIDAYDEGDATSEAWDHFKSDDDSIDLINTHEPKRVLKGVKK